MNDKTREAFEAWFEPDEHNRESISKDRFGAVYREGAFYLNGCWQGWLAATEAKDARIRQLEEALKETAQSLAWLAFGECRGFSERLLTSKNALEMARAALKDPS